MAALGDLRVEENLRVKIGEAKNLPSHSVSNSGRNTFCAVRLDSEEIFRTTTIEKSLNPFYGEEFQGEIPKKFRFLSFYVYESSGKTEKVLGKVTLKKEELYKYHNKEHWFPLTHQDVDAEVQGKVHIEVRFDEYLNTNPESFASHRMTVRVLECSDLSVVNGSCNPYAVVTLSHDKSKHKDVKRTNVKKKTICPQFEETFFFDLENKGQNHDRTLYAFEDAFSGELSVSVWHDDSRVSREVLGHMFRGSFLGEVRIPLRGLDINTIHSAWYCLRGREHSKNHHQEMGSLRLKISYETDHIFLSHYYNDLRKFILQSPDVHPITSSAAYILGHIVDNRQECAQPLMKLFLHHDKLVPLVKCLADWEMSKTTDSNTFFRGNTLVTKMIDELMKLVGIPYLHDTLKPSISKVCSEQLACEIDSTRLKDGENINDNLTNLKNYVVDMVTAITNSGLVCPVIMREVFHALKEVATTHFPENAMIKYRVISSFVFLRFFAPAILGPKLFEIHAEPQATSIGRTLTLISKAVQGLVNVVSSKSVPFSVKEEYMIPLFDDLTETKFVDAIKMFLDIVSSPTGTHTQCFEAPIILKEGMLIKRAQGRKRFGLKNFKRRFFCLTNQSLSYSKTMNEKPLCSIPIEDILAVEKLEEESFKMKYMFQVIQPQHALYIQATNCVEEKQWLDILTKVCNTNKNRLQMYHPAAYMNNHWLCCKLADSNAPGCSPVSGGLPVTEMQIDVDSDREVEKIHSLFLTYMDKLDALQEACACQEVYSGDSFQQHSVVIDDTKSCYETLAEIQKHVISLEQAHKQYLKMLHKHTIVGSIDAPIGDESYGLGMSGTRL
ncbi:ras GTPase-activating protein 3-like isoform X2 [Gigantopelta aegis]|uniref:ras GTPase-activating protein 3-like isoform X2 n=1 Tax=Gigantopelta aegis TaxID=1735272 RepID=UPI001B888A1C|nr:ras GTPase-activating protein 3-like isoform X2 [Gigantopelta aegis]